MNMSKISYSYINQGSEYYDQSVRLRYDIFYKSTKSELSCVVDDKEKDGYHLVAIKSDQVVGYARLNINESLAVITQFCVHPKWRELNIGKDMFNMLLNRSKKSKVKEIHAEIRLHMTEICRRYGFEVDETTFPSKKTGILHRYAILKLT